MIKEATVVKMTNGVAVGGLALPAWWPSLLQASEVAAAIVPILSAAWLLIQIVRTLSARQKKDPE